MGVFTAGQVVVLPFPYSDLSGQKHRPVLLLASAGHDDWIICQITSNPFADPFAVPLTSTSFASGGLHHDSYARPVKLFTANQKLIVAHSGTLHDHVLHQVREAAVTAIRRG